ncbi:MAG: extracellular solute-binding protein [Rubrivivax sp.]|jgi:multiple sugar transport system substrate-binding protein
MSNGIKRRDVNLAAMAAGALATLPWAGQSMAQTGKHTPFTIVINNSPWFNGFRKTVEAYEAETGNKVNLDVNPFGGSLEKQRASVRAKDGMFDLLIMNGLYYQEFYHGGFLTPLNDIDPSFKLDPQMVRYDNTVYWDEASKTHNPKGKLMSVPVNGNIPILLYRADLYEQYKLKVPDTWDDLLANAKKLHNPPRMYGIVQRGARGAPNDISYDWWPYMNSFNANLFRDEAKGDFTITINSPEAKAALDFYIRMAKEAGHPQTGGLAQAQIIQNIVTGRAAHALLVIAAWAQMDDPSKSAVVGKINAARVPRSANGKPAPVLGHWLGGIPRNVPKARQAAALAFLNWFQTQGSQIKYMQAGAPPVRQDVLSDQALWKDPKNRWMPAMAESSAYTRLMWSVPEGSQIGDVLELRLNQAVIGQMTSAQALNAIADEAHAIMQRAGYKTGKLAPLS